MFWEQIRDPNELFLCPRWRASSLLLSNVLYAKARHTWLLFQRHECLLDGYGEKSNLPYTLLLRWAARALACSEEGSREAWVVAEGAPRRAFPGARDSVSSRCPGTRPALLHVFQAHFGMCICIFSAFLGGHALKRGDCEFEVSELSLLTLH